MVVAKVAGVMTDIKQYALEDQRKTRIQNELNGICLYFHTNNF